MTITVECDYCGADVEKYASNVKGTDNSYCDQECYSQDMKEKPPEEHNNYQGGKISVDCSYCGEQDVKEVWPTRLSQDNFFCDQECMSAFMEVEYSGEGNPNFKGVNQTFICDYCGDEFTAPKHARQEEHTFCTEDCMGKWLSENNSGEDNPLYNRVNVDCDNCGNKISIESNTMDEYDNHFCDNSCKYEWLSEHLIGEAHPRYNKREYTCENCGEKFKSIPSHRSYDRTFCSNDCQAEWQRTITGEEHPLYRGGHNEGFTQSERNEIFQRDNYTCQECGDEESPIHAHHIVPVHKSKEKEHDVENGKTLCVECHAEKHPEIEELILAQKD